MYIFLHRFRKPVKNSNCYFFHQHNSTGVQQWMQMHDSMMMALPHLAVQTYVCCKQCQGQGERCMHRVQCLVVDALSVDIRSMCCLSYRMTGCRQVVKELRQKATSLIAALSRRFTNTSLFVMCSIRPTRSCTNASWRQSAARHCVACWHGTVGKVLYSFSVWAYAIT